MITIRGFDSTEQQTSLFSSDDNDVTEEKSKRVLPLCRNIDVASTMEAIWAIQEQSK